MAKIRGNQENPPVPPSSAALFALMQKAESISEYRDLYDQYWKKRKEERSRPSEAPEPGPAAQDLPEGTIKSSRKKSGRRQAEQGGGGGS